MSRLQAIQFDAATGKAKELLDAVQAKLKITPNMTRVMANSPAVLEAYLGFSGALSHGALDAKLREEIALEVGEQNSCQYCVSSRRTIPASARATRRLLHNTRTPSTISRRPWNSSSRAWGGPTKTSRVSSLVCWNLIGASFRLKLLLRDCI
jgi:AhpD family alkylhydroperoxidase